MIIEGKLVTTNLTDINMGMEEFIEHSFYDDWTKTGPQRYTTDPLGNPLSPYHAWNKTTLPKPTGTNFKERYTWDTAPRWDRQVVETGAYGQLWGTALRGDYAENPFCEPTGDGLRMLVPRHALPETELFWPLPRTLNALERNRARAYSHGLHRHHRHELPAQGVRVLAQGRDQGPHPVQDPPDERIVGGLLGGRPGLPAATT